jgi:hypothetical protein
VDDWTWLTKDHQSKERRNQIIKDLLEASLYSSARMHASDFRRTDDEAARRGHPSYVWRAGQERRLAMVRRWAKLEARASWITAAASGCTPRNSPSSRPM